MTAGLYSIVWIVFAQMISFQGVNIQGVIVPEEVQATTSCSTESQAAWDAENLQWQPIERTAAQTQVGDACVSIGLTSVILSEDQSLP